MAHLDVSEAGPARWGKPRALRPTVWQMAVALLVLATLAAFLPLRFTAGLTLAFDVGTQPPAAAVRGVTQMLASRELAYEAAARLPAADQARLGTGGAFGLGLTTTLAPPRKAAAAASAKPANGCVASTTTETTPASPTADPRKAASAAATSACAASSENPVSLRSNLAKWPA